MNIFFDMDYTILSVTGLLRPGTEELFRRLRADGHTLFIWSGVGVRRTEVRRLGLEGYLDGVFEKPLFWGIAEEYRGRVRAMLDRGDIPVIPDFVVDDHPMVVSSLGGAVARPYVYPDPTDTELERIYRAISDAAAAGLSGPGPAPGPEPVG